MSLIVTGRIATFKMLVLPELLYVFCTIANISPALVPTICPIASLHLHLEQRPPKMYTSDVDSP